MLLFLFAIVLAFSSTIGYPVSENESLFDSDPVALDPLIFNDAGAVDAFDTDPVPMTDVLALTPPTTEIVNGFSQVPTDFIDTDALDPDLLGGLDPPVLLAADYWWEWDCPDGRKPYCCSERGVGYDNTVFGGCRDCRSFFCFSLRLFIHINFTSSDMGLSPRVSKLEFC